MGRENDDDTDHLSGRRLHDKRWRKALTTLSPRMTYVALEIAFSISSLSYYLRSAHRFPARNIVVTFFILPISGVAATYSDARPLDSAMCNQIKLTGMRSVLAWSRIVLALTHRRLVLRFTAGSMHLFRICLFSNPLFLTFAIPWSETELKDKDPALVILNSEPAWLQTG